MTPSVNNRPIPVDLAEFLSRRMRDVSSSINSCLVGTVVQVNTNQTVTVSINFQKVIKAINPIANNTVAGATDQIQSYPLLVNVPYFIYQGGGACIVMPVAVGDPCVVLFCDRDMDVWFETGQIAPPNSDRVHSINDAIALIGINSLQDLLSFTPSSVVQVIDKTGERLPISGMMLAWGGSTAPSGWLMCDGSSYLRTAYPLLFAVIGTTYGSVDGTHFNVPQLAGQVPVGIGGTLGLTLGQQFGEVTHLLTGPESGVQAHSHGIVTDKFSDQGSYISNTQLGSGFERTINTNVAGDTNAVTAHNNVQPSLGVNWIIKI